MIKQCLCCGRDFKPPVGAGDYQFFSYEYCSDCVLARCDIRPNHDQIKIGD